MSDDMTVIKSYQRASIRVGNIHGPDWFPLHLDAGPLHTTIYLHRDELRALRDRLDEIDRTVKEPDDEQCDSMFSNTRRCHRAYGHEGLHETTFNGVSYAWKGSICEVIKAEASDPPSWCQARDPWNNVPCEYDAGHEGYHRAGKHTWVSVEVAT